MEMGAGVSGSPRFHTNYYEDKVSLPFCNTLEDFSQRGCPVSG